MTTLFLLVTGVCQSLNELGVVSVTEKWSVQNRTARPLATALLSLHELFLTGNVLHMSLGFFVFVMVP